MVMANRLATVNTVLYGEMSQGARMTDQLSAQDWLDQGLKTLAKDGFTALKAEPLANAWAMRGRHFGWMALSAVVALAVAGY